MAIYITGDTHGDFQRFGSKYFPQQKEMSREDYVVIPSRRPALSFGAHARR